MKWSFRSKLILAFLLFSLVPTLLMTLVTFEATEQLKDRVGRVIRYPQRAGRGPGARPLLAGGSRQPSARPRPVRTFAPVVELFDQMIREVQIPNVRMVLVGARPDGGHRPGVRDGDRELFAAGEKLPNPYAELIRPVRPSSGSRVGEARPTTRSTTEPRVRGDRDRLHHASTARRRRPRPVHGPGHRAAARRLRADHRDPIREHGGLRGLRWSPRS